MNYEKGHEGFLNYETWVMALWLNNDEASHRYWKDAARETWRNSREYFEEPDPSNNYLGAATFYLSLRLQEEITAGVPDLGSTVFADLLNAALSEVDWSGVAEDFLEGVAG